MASGFTDFGARNYLTFLAVGAIITVGVALETLGGVRFATIMAGLVSFIVALVDVSNQNKRWVLNPAIDTRTHAVLDAYHQFLNAFYRINRAANIGEDKDTFDASVRQPLDDCRIAVDKIDIWVSKRSSGELRDILALYAKFGEGIWAAKGMQPHIHSKDWEAFVGSVERVKTLVSREIRSQELREFIFSTKI